MFIMGTVASKQALIEGWDIANASYDGKSLAVGGQEATPTGVYFKPDGTKLYVVGYGGDEINQYSMSTSWDISTATYDNKLKSVSSEGTVPFDVNFSTDGTKMYVLQGGDDKIYQYTLSTAWDVSTATYDTVNKSVNSQDSAPEGFTFKPDGTKMYMVGQIQDDVFQYSLSTAWDLSTLTYDSKALNCSSQSSTTTNAFFKTDGTKVFVLDRSTDDVYQYSLSTAWDVSTGSYDNKKYNQTTQTDPQGLFFKPDGTQMYIIGTTFDKMYQFTVPAPA